MAAATVLQNQIKTDIDTSPPLSAGPADQEQEKPMLKTILLATAALGIAATTARAHVTLEKSEACRFQANGVCAWMY